MIPPSRAPTTDELLAHAGWLRRLAAQLVVDGAAADDLVQETWLAALRKGPQRPREVRAWLATVLRNAAVSRQRRDARRARREEDHAACEALPSAAVLTARAEANRRLVEAVLTLSETQRVVVLLRYYEEMSTVDIAARLGCPAATVRSHLMRAKQSLRAELERDGAAEGVSWLEGLVPLSLAATESTSLAGAAAMTAATKATLIALPILALGAAWWWSGSDTEPATVNDAVAASHAPSASEAEADPVELPRVTVAAREALETPKVLVSAPSSASGIVVDARGEPVPWYVLGIAASAPLVEPEIGREPPQTLERVVTDGAGRFRSSGSFPKSTLQAVPLEDWERSILQQRLAGADAPKPSMVFSHDPADQEGARLVLDVGPAFRIDCPEAKGIGFAEFAAMLSTSIHPLTEAFLTAHVVADPVPFVRFRPLEREERRMDLGVLQLVSLDGRLAGWARVERELGLDGAPVSIDLHPTGSLRVNVAADAPPALDEATLALWPGALTEAETASASPTWERFTSTMFGGSGAPAFGLRYLSVGTHTIRIRAPGCADHVASVDVRTREQKLDVVLVRTALASGRIAGRVVPRSGAKPAADHVAWLMDENASSTAMPRKVDLDWARVGDRWEADFAFEGLVDGEYRVWINFDMHVPRSTPKPKFVPRNHYVRPDGELLQFELIEPARARRLLVGVEDASTGASVEKFRAAAFLPASRSEPVPVDGKDGAVELELRGALDGGRLWVAADGYAAQFTELPAAPDADGVWRADVRLVPGWGAPVRAVVRDGEARGPVEGVDVLADGAVVARTDAQGIAWLTLAARPIRLDARAPHYRVVGRLGSMDAEGVLNASAPDPMAESYTFELASDR